MHMKKIHHYTKDLTVLYVEDDYSVAKNIVETLNLFFKEVIYKDDGFKALDLYKKNIDKFDIVLVDIIMPKMNGIDMIEQI